MVISTLSSGGAERNTCMLANHFAKQNDVTLITLQKSKSCFYPLLSKIKIQNLNLIRNNLTIFTKVSNFIKRVYILRNNLIREKPEILISFLETTNITVLISSLFIKNIRIRIISDRNNPNFSENKFLINIFKVIFYRYADVLVLQTKKIKENFTFLNSKKIQVIPNTISEKIKEKKNYYNKKKFKIISVGRLEDQKGYDILLKSLFLLKEKKLNFVCDIYGNGSKKKEILNIIKINNLLNQVKVKGVKKNIFSLYKKYDLFVLSSKFEGFPNSLLEALSTGLPCISSDCDYGPSEIIKNNINGLLFKNSNHLDLYKKIKYLIENRDKLKLYSYNAKKEFNYSIFNEDKIHKWEKLLKKK